MVHLPWNKTELSRPFRPPVAHENMQEPNRTALSTPFFLKKGRNLFLSCPAVISVVTFFIDFRL
jgi:hypothetical protein